MTTFAIVITVICSLAVGAIGGVFAARKRRTVLGIVAHIAAVVLMFAVMSGARRDLGPYGRASSVHPADRAAWWAKSPRERWEFRVAAGVCAFVPTLCGAIGGVLIARRRSVVTS